MTTADDRAQLKRVAFWLNAILDAWSMGEAPWAYDSAGSVAVRAFSDALQDAA